MTFIQINMKHDTYVRQSFAFIVKSFLVAIGNPNVLTHGDHGKETVTESSMYKDESHKYPVSPCQTRCFNWRNLNNHKTIISRFILLVADSILQIPPGYKQPFPT